MACESGGLKTAPWNNKRIKKTGKTNQVDQGMSVTKKPRKKLVEANAMER